ncbi:proteoglycan 4-like [Cynara cardunculus var. scolymus]|uniref:proteoglycan 4-like n=1 Tax=Cynara cardunculus var. scolymus TaxID=59895 RepID=UPI000D629F50|nr:proteoglycan 4-like [Cynara cardunculus var. scolymus]
MAERKPSGFRFRLPWLLQPALTSRSAIAPEPPRTTTQTSVVSTPAQRPPFRPAGIAPAPVARPSTLATPAPPPVSPTQAPPRSATSPVPVVSSPPPVPAKSSAPKSALAKNLDPVANQPRKETQTTSEIAGAIPLGAARTADDGETQPMKGTHNSTKMASPTTLPAIDKVAATIKTQTTGETPGPAVPIAAARTADVGETQPMEKTQATTELASPATPLAIDKVADTIKTQTTSETPGPAVPLAAAKITEADEFQSTKETQAATDMASSTTPPAIAKIANTIETQLTKETLTTTGTKPTIETPAPATPPQRLPLRPPSPVNIQPLQTDTSPRSPSRLASQSTEKPSSSSPITTSAVSHNTPGNMAIDSNNVSQGVDLALDAKSKEIAKAKGKQTKSLNRHSMDKITERKSQKPKAIPSARLSLHREIKDDIFKFIHKMATSPPKRYMDEKPASVVTVAGDNTGASMHLGSDVTKRDIQRGYKVNPAINGEGNSNGRDSESNENEETKAIVNSNIQGINNSMMFNSSVTDRNPGVHLGFFHNIANNNDSKMENRGSMETHKAEANITPQQTLVYDPTIGRCLEGVSMEACDLEADDDKKSVKGYEIEVA